MYKGHKIIALCISKTGDERNFEFINALNLAAVERGFRLFIYQTCSDLFRNMRSENGDKTVFELIDYDVVDAVIVFDDAFYDKEMVGNIISGALTHEKPVISVGAEHEGCINFNFDYQSGFEKIVRHIICEHGAKNTAFIAGKRNEPNSDERIAVYKRVLAENNLEFDESRFFYGDYWWKPTIAAVNHILTDVKPLPDAIICANDTMAITVCDEMKKHGFSVPGDVLVTGFDGIMGSKNSEPPITTAKCDAGLASEKMMGVFENIFDGQDVEQDFYMEFSMEKRESCGCADVLEDLDIGARLRNTEERFQKYQDDEKTFNEISEMVISADALEKIPEYFRQYLFLNTYVILNEDCLDASINPSESSRTESFDENMLVLFNSRREDSRIIRDFDRRSIIPDMDDLIDCQNPMVFSALSFLGFPMGYVCFAFDLSIDNYQRVQQQVTFINNSIGNYRMVRHLKYTAKNIEEMAEHDFMTGLYNRKGFYACIGDVLDSADGEDYLLTASLDLDGLKHINDKFGHEDGDFAIKSVADAIKRIPFVNKICGRFGGDEFVVCAAVKDEDAPDILKKSVDDYLEWVNLSSKKPFKVSASIGVHMMLTTAFDFESALKRSDEEMYAVKVKKTNRRMD